MILRFYLYRFCRSKLFFKSSTSFYR